MTFASVSVDCAGCTAPLVSATPCVDYCTGGSFGNSECERITFNLQVDEEAEALHDQSYCDKHIGVVGFVLCFHADRGK